MARLIPAVGPVRGCRSGGQAKGAKLNGVRDRKGRG
jgi:hypothetical protein